MRRLHRRVEDRLRALGIDPPLRDVRFARPRAPAKPEILVVGEFSAGKSSLINALLGEPLLPVGIAETTAAVCRVRYGLTAARVQDDNGDGSVYEHPNRLLKRLDLVDTPGANTPITTHRLLASEAAAEQPVWLYVTRADQCLKMSELAWLRGQRCHEVHLLIAINQVDRLGSDDQDRVLQEARETLARGLGLKRVTLIATSALTAMHGERTASRSGEGSLRRLSVQLEKAARGHRKMQLRRNRYHLQSTLRGIHEGWFKQGRIACSERCKRAAQARDHWKAAIESPVANVLAHLRETLLTELESQITTEVSDFYLSKKSGVLQSPVRARVAGIPTLSAIVEQQSKTWTERTIAALGQSGHPLLVECPDLTLRIGFHVNQPDEPTTSGFFGFLSVLFSEFKTDEDYLRDAKLKYLAAQEPLVRLKARERLVLTARQTLRQRFEELSRRLTKRYRAELRAATKTLDGEYNRRRRLAGVITAYESRGRKDGKDGKMALAEQEVHS